MLSKRSCCAPCNGFSQLRTNSKRLYNSDVVFAASQHSSCNCRSPKSGNALNEPCRPGMEMTLSRVPGRIETGDRNSCTCRVVECTPANVNPLTLSPSPRPSSGLNILIQQLAYFLDVIIRPNRHVLNGNQRAVIRCSARHRRNGLWHSRNRWQLQIL